MAVLSEIESSLSQRVIKCFETLGFGEKKAGKTEFAELLSVSKANLSKYFALDRPFPIEGIVNLATKAKISTNWLLTGEGEMFTSILDEVKKKDEEDKHQLSENEKQIIERILELAHYLRETRRISFQDFSKSVGLNSLDIESYNISRSRLTPDLLINISKTFFVDAQWLLTGEGDMIRGSGYRFRKALPIFDFISKNLDYFKENKENIENQIFDLEHKSNNATLHLISFYRFLEHTDFKRIIKLKNKRINDLTEIDLNIIGLVRTHEKAEFPNLYFCYDFFYAKLYFNKNDGDFVTRDLKPIFNEKQLVHYNEYPLDLDYLAKNPVEEYEMPKLKTLLTTEELINEVFQWKFKW